MVWRRLPTYFPNISLHMMKLSPENLQTLKQTGYLREAAFRTTPNVTKPEIKAFLEAVYDVSVDKVHTINYLGQKKMRADKNGKPFFVRLQDWKKAYVIFKHPAALMQGAAGKQEAGEELLPAAAAAGGAEGAAAAAVPAAEGGAQQATGIEDEAKEQQLK